MTDQTAPEASGNNVVVMNPPPQGRTMPSLDIDATWRRCKALAMSPLIPTSFLGSKQRKFSPEEIAGNLFLAIGYGHEVGLSPSQAIQSVAVIHGKTSIYGDALIAVLRGSGLFVGKGWKESWDEKNKTFSCTMERQGGEKRVVKYSYAKADKLGLPSKNALYRQDPETMLKWRARHECARELFADVLRGLTVAEVAQDDALIEIEGEVVDVGDPPVETVAETVVEADPVLEDDLDDGPSPLEDSLEELEEPQEEQELLPEDDGPPDDEHRPVIDLGQTQDGKPAWNAWYKAMGENAKAAMTTTDLECLWEANAGNVKAFEGAHPKFYATLLETFKARKKALKG